MKRTVLILTTSILVLFAHSFKWYDDPKKDSRANNDNDMQVISSRQMNINNISAWYRNNGSFNRDPSTGNSGFQWPKTTSTFARYASGLWLGAQVGDDTLVAVAEYDYEYLPGYVDNNGIPQGKDDPGYKVYVINRGNTQSDDYVRWPAYQGAHITESGLPFMMGDQTMFCSFTDGYPEAHGNSAGRTSPLKAHILQTNWCYSGSNPYSILGNTIFTEYRIINKSNKVWRNFYISIWTDDDLGDANDDAVGCDSVNHFSYTYNSDNNDPNYGLGPPAVGIVVLRGPLIDSDSDSAKFYDPPTSGKVRVVPSKKTSYSSSSVFESEDWEWAAFNYITTYRLMQAKSRYDLLITNPVTGNKTRYHFTGDPETQTGWNMPWSGDRRFMISMGPVNMNPNDTQKIVIAQHIARGANNLNSVTQFRKNAIGLRRFFDADFPNIIEPPPAPIMSVKPGENGSALITLRDSNEHLEIDNLLSTGTYRFQGYNIYQIRNYSPYPATSDTVKILTYDVTDNVGNIYDSIYLKEYNTTAFALVQSGNNRGITRTTKIDRDTFTGLTFKEGYEYIFAVSAYYYDPQGGLKTFPKVLFSKKSTVTFTAQPPAIGTVINNSYGDFIPTNQRDPGVFPLITDPLRLLTANYVSTVYSNSLDSNLLFWNLIRSESGRLDTLFTDQKFLMDSMITGMPTDGFDHFQYLRKDSGVARDIQKISYPDLKEIKYQPWQYSPQGSDWFTAPDTNAVKTAKVIANRQFECRSLGMSFPTAGTYRNTPSLIKANGRYLSQVSEDNRLLKGGPLRKIKIKFGENFKSKSYRFVPQDTSFVNTPCMGMVEVPFSVFIADELDSSGGMLRQVNTGFMDADSSSTWNPKGGDETNYQKLGGYEFTYIFASVYDPNPLSEYLSKIPGISNTTFGFPSMDVMYVWLPRAKSVNGQLQKWSEGDELTVWPLRITRNYFVPGFPLKYEYSTKGAEQNVTSVAASEIDKINIFPNPYYGSSELEYNSAGEKFIYINNLPQKSVIYIYSLDGILVKKISRNSNTPESSLEKWDLKNNEGAFVASGIYLIFVDCPGIGAKTLKAAIMQNKF